MLKDISLAIIIRLVFMQDGAPAQYAIQVRPFLSEEIIRKQKNELGTDKRSWIVFHVNRLKNDDENLGFSRNGCF